MKAWNPRRRRIADERREVERATVLSEIRRRDCTAKELARRSGFSLFRVRRALRALRREMLVTWLPQRSTTKHAYTRIYLATSRTPRRRARA